MNRTEEITSRLAVIKKSLQATNLFTLALRVEDVEKLIKDLPDFQRIDEERFKRIYASKVCDIGLHIKEYNSTLPPALVLLPKEMPALWHNALTDLLHNRMQPSEFYLLIRKTYGTPANKLQPLPKATPYEFVGLFNESHSPRKIWEWLLSHYGTPEPKPNLPSVEELAKEMLNVWNVNTFNEVAEYVIEKYSLHPREWWQDCEKFMYKGSAYKKYSHEVFPDGRIVLHSELAGHDLTLCTPYTPPTADDIIAKHNLSEEEVRAIREGRCT